METKRHGILWAICMAIEIEIGDVFFSFASGMGVGMQKWFLLLSPTPRNVFAFSPAIQYRDTKNGFTIY